MEEMTWSKREKEVARKAYRAAYERECTTILERVRRMAGKANEPKALWEIHNYLTQRRKETDQKYEYRYSVLIEVFARLMVDGWLKAENLAGLSEDKLEKIRGLAQFTKRL